MSRTDKVTRILNLYYQLLAGKNINKQNFILENRISGRSFDRDIEDIRLYLSEEQSYCELEFDRGRNSYYLTQAFGTEMPFEIAFLLIDMVLSLKTISKDEVEGVVEAIIDSTGLQANKELKEFILNHFEYKNNWGNCAILKIHRDLEYCIYKKVAIKINYEIKPSVIEQRVLLPVNIKYDDGYFYLIAFRSDKDYEDPAIYRIDRIKSFSILQRSFDNNIEKDFLVNNKQRDMFHMMGGEKINVSLKISTKSKNVVMDVFPNSIIVCEDTDFIVFQINTYKNGFINWALSQQDAIILSPIELKIEVIDRLKEMLDKYNS